MPKGISNTTHKPPSYGKRTTIETRLKQRNTRSLSRGLPIGWQDDALDLYLMGEPVCEIARAYSVSPHSVQNAIGKTALYRLLRMHQAEYLAEVRGLDKEQLS